MAAAAEDGAQPALDAQAEADPPPADRAPRSGGSRRKASTPPAGGDDRRPAGIRKIQDGLTQLFTLAGLGTSLWVDQWDGEVLVLNAERLARSWADLAQQSPTVRRALEALLMGSAWGSAIGTTAMVAVPILARHGVIPPESVQVAAGQGVRMPTIGQPPAEDAPPPPAAFTPEAPTQPAAAAPPPEPRHPMDGSATNGALPADPSAPAFPAGDVQPEAA